MPSLRCCRWSAAALHGQLRPTSSVLQQQLTRPHAILRQAPMRVAAQAAYMTSSIQRTTPQRSREYDRTQAEEVCASDRTEVDQISNDTTGLSTASAGLNFQHRLHDVWFAGVQRGSYPPPAEQQQLWFYENDAMNAYLTDQFSDDLYRYIDEKNSRVPPEQSSYQQLEDTAAGSLSLIILLSQIAPRIYSGDADRMQLNKDAALLSWLAISNGHDLSEDINDYQRLFFLMPLLQSRQPSSMDAAYSRAEEYQRQAEWWAKPWWRQVMRYMQQVRAQALQQRQKIDDATTTEATEQSVDIGQQNTAEHIANRQT